MMEGKKEYTKKEWEELGKKLFGTKDKKKWRFKCPACGISIIGQEWIQANEPEMFAFSCIGRARKNKGEFLVNEKQPCNYAGGGLFRLNPITITEGEEKIDIFEFDTPEKDCI